MGDGIDFTDIGQELVAQPSPFEAPRTRPAMSTKVSRVGNDLLGARDPGQIVETRIRHRDLADIRLDGAEREIGSLARRRLSQR